ncbi:hypothetical protein ACQPW1_39910 [Nocardia sp. CA-128927]|uniref:hypothetical protein n=1 Tax=Nocardia sp. CA-128927 TaxID=3239975 RepID=UPI003D951EA3
MTLPLGGAPVPHRVDRVVPARFGSLLPLRTPTVNIVGSALLGGSVGAAAGNRLPATTGTGFRGLIAVFVAAATTQWLWP